MRLPGLLCAVPWVATVLNVLPVWADNEPARTMSGREAYTADHQLLVKLLAVPRPIPMEQYFSVRLAVYDGRDPHQELADAQWQVAVGMAHGMAQGFMHEMQSAPRIETQNGVATVSGLFFHMSGDWTMRVTVHAAGHAGIVSFNLPCCE